MKKATTQQITGGTTLGLAMLAILMTACSPTPMAAKAVNASSSLSSAGVSAGKVSVSVANSSGQVIYSDASAGTSSLVLRAGQSYTLNLSQGNAVAGSSYSLQLRQTNIVGGSSVSIPLQLGANSFTVPVQGDYALTIVATPPGGAAVNSFYVAQVTCASPTFSAASLNASKIMVSSGSAANLFNLSASGVTAAANGVAPYSCAWDPTGTGIQDTAFQSCDTPLSNFYSNFLGSRKVGLIVKDACNSTFSIANTQTFTSAEPGMPGNVFISGRVSGASGSAVGDARIDGVSYLATNAAGYNIVNPDYNKGSFQIESLINYGQPSSVRFGIQIRLTGINDTLDISKGTGSADVSGASIQNISFATDQAGDKSPAVSLSGSNCTLTNQGSKVMFIAGQPCSGGSTGDTNQATVEVWGHYSCSGVNASGASINIQGNFDGVKALVDSCSGSGGSTGGIDPIKF